MLTQGKPAALEVLACMEHWLREQKNSASSVAADMVPVAIDGYLREQDLVQLRVADLSFDAHAQSMSAHFGRASRGESSKTGREQGVVFDEPHSVQILRRRIAGKKPDDRVFSISADVYRKWWRATSRAVGVDVGPPHTARHTGASRDLATNYRTFDQVQRRGRWKAADSVQRYARPHEWATVCAAVPEDVRLRGTVLLAARPPRPSQARSG